MKRSNRLRRSDQFERVRRKGQTWNHRLLRLNVATNHCGRVRCGLIANKHIGNAVQRNRARRRVREAVRLVLDNIQQEVDIIFIIRNQEIIAIPFAYLQTIIQQLLHQAGIWHNGDNKQ